MKMFWRQAWNHVKRGHGLRPVERAWAERRKRGSSVCFFVPRPYSSPNRSESSPPFGSSLRESGPRFPTAQCSPRVAGYWQLVVSLVTSADYFQTCAVMCAELGAADPPACWLLYPIRPLVLKRFMPAICWLTWETHDSPSSVIDSRLNKTETGRNVFYTNLADVPL